MPLDTLITHDAAGAYILKLTGKLDAESTPQFQCHVEALLADPAARTVRLELAELTFISSMGLGLVAQIRNVMAERGGAIVIVGAQPPIAKVFELMKVLPKQTLCA